MGVPKYSGRGRIYEGDATAIERRVRDLMRRYMKDQEAETVKSSVSNASSGLANTNVGPSADPPLAQDSKTSLTVPNNSTADLGPFSPKADFGNILLFVGWQRGTTEGCCLLAARHDGTSGRFFFLAGENPGYGTFSLIIAGDNMTLRFAANNVGNDIEQQIEILSRIPTA